MAGRWRVARAGSRHAERAEGTDGAQSSAGLGLACTRSSAPLLAEALPGPADCGGGADPTLTLLDRLARRTGALRGRFTSGSACPAPPLPSAAGSSSS
ncbi:hypothetical protein NN561_015486 [Cricetulus griseus]